MAEAVEKRFKGTCLPHTVQWLTDNGPAYRAWATISYGRELGLEVCSTAPRSPESNGMAEAFVKTLKRDYCYVGDLSSARRVIKQIPHWIETYNNKAPHKGLNMMPPSVYRQQNLAEKIDGQQWILDGIEMIKTS